MAHRLESQGIDAAVRESLHEDFDRRVSSIGMFRYDVGLTCRSSVLELRLFRS